jgi:hypothetical protein
MPALWWIRSAGQGGALFNDLYCLDIHSAMCSADGGAGTSGPNGGASFGVWRWSVVEHSGAIPSPRFQHTLCVAAGKLHVWGGAKAIADCPRADAASRANTGTHASSSNLLCSPSLHSFDPESNQWSESKPGPDVEALHSHSVVVVSDGSALLFFGGTCADGAVSDTIRLCKIPLATAAAAYKPVWSRLTVTGPAAVLEKRCQHSACFHKRSGQVLIFGGMSATDTLGSIAVIRVEETPRPAIFVALIAVLVLLYFLFIACKVSGVLGEGANSRLT